MRITNQMMTNNMLSHINQNKLNMSKLENQYSTGKKILKPSDDPIVAVRALKLRSNLTEITQYLEKNIPDAESWMEVTESALNNVNSILTKMNTYCVQGSSDTLTAEDRTSILQNLIQLKEQIYQEGNSQYAGRYVFTGFKTDTPLIYTSEKNYKNEEEIEVQWNHGGTGTNCTMFTVDNIESISSISINNNKITDVIQMTSVEFAKITPDPDKVYYIMDTNKLAVGTNHTLNPGTSFTITAEKFSGYEIKESFTGTDITYFKTVVTPEDATKTPKTVQANRIQLSYNNIYTQTSINAAGKEVVTSSVDSISYTIGNQTDRINVVTKDSTDEGAYQPGADEVYLLADTGELILGENVATKLKDATDISVVYKKNSFATNELKPEHFFDATFVAEDGKVVNYEKKSQDITYEINFGQTLKVNTEAKEAITHEIDRLIDDVTTAVNNVTAIENQISAIKEELANINIDPAQKKTLETKLEQLNTSLTLSKSIMQETFASAITGTKQCEDKVNVAVADLGSRAKRLELTKERLEDQKVELEDLKSSNEDVDLVETVIRYKSAESIYTSSLSAAASVIKTNLLNFL